MTTEEKQYLLDLRTVMNTRAGSNVLCAVLEKLGVTREAWNDKNSILAKQTVLKDFGDDLQDDLAMASDEGFGQLQKKMRTRRRAAGTLLTVNLTKGDTV